jgi:hypothetical protein
MEPFCQNCGTRWQKGHKCDPQRVKQWTEFKVDQAVKADTDKAVTEIRDFLESKAGQFELYYAARERTKT